MMRKYLAPIALLLAAVLLFGCAPAPEEATAEEDYLKPADVAGLWKAAAGPFAVLSLSEDGTYFAKDADGRTVLAGSFVVEGDYAVLDGYGVDDPDRTMALLYDASDDAFTVETAEGKIRLTRTEEIPVTEEADPSVWYGAFSSDLGRIVIGRGASEDTALVAASPKEGVTLSASVVFDEDGTAFCDLFILSLNGDELTAESISEESAWITGVYQRENAAF
ncbi:MAG: hypothetical protein II776_04670 [Clostridia bacterium]|nr:hypothetical protein [Clostridia bacterium]